jgi:hypothetical protein
MPLYWLCYQHNNQISVVIEPGASLIHARMRASLAGLDEGTFTEGHELDRSQEIVGEIRVANRQRGAEVQRRVPLETAALDGAPNSGDLTLYIFHAYRSGSLFHRRCGLPYQHEDH